MHLAYIALVFVIPLSIVRSMVKSIFSRKKRSFYGKTILITGAANGLGKELARQLSRIECTILCVDFKPKDLEMTVKELEQDANTKAEINSYVCDISDVTSVNNLRDSVLKDFKKLDILINNAAFLLLATIERGQERVVKRCVDVNLLGALWMCRAFLPSMKENRTGHIVFINSIAAFVAEKGLAVYSMTKAAISSLASCLIQELEERPEWKDILVSSAHPYFMDTNPRYKEFYKTALPMVPLDIAAEEILHGIQMGHQEFHVPGGELRAKLTLLIARVLPASVMQFLKWAYPVEVATIEDYTMIDKIMDPNVSYKQLMEIVTPRVQFASDEKKQE